MDILIGGLGSLLFIGVLVYQLQRLKMLYKTKQDPLFVVGNLFIFLMVLCWVAFVLTATLSSVLSSAGAKNLLLSRLGDVELASLRGCFFLILGLGLYFLAVRLPFIVINRRHQRKELARLGWQERKPGAKLDAEGFKHLFIIGITSWKSEDLRGIEILQRCFRHDDWTVQVLFLEDTDAWPTPTVSEYQDGVLVRLLSGKDALAWMKTA